MVQMFDLTRAVASTKPTDAIIECMALAESAERLGWDAEGVDWSQVHRGLCALLSLTGVGKSDAVALLGQQMVRLRDAGVYDTLKENE